MMKRVFKWTGIVVLTVAIIGFGAFLYFIPPFFVSAPETFSVPQNNAAPAVSDIADPAQRALAERGRYIVVTSGCIGCHQTPTAQGPDFNRYLAGGMQFRTREGTYVTRNLTPDKQTGLGRRTDEEVERVLRSGVFPDGRIVSHRVMPWASYTNWTEEDRRAVIAYLRHLKPVAHQTPEPAPPMPLSYPNALEVVPVGKDYGGASK
jgi:mono/diheme cytochrome c family protein